MLPSTAHTRPPGQIPNSDAINSLPSVGELFRKIPKLLTCKRCRKYFTNRSAFRQHIDRYLGRFKCLECKRSFGSLADLKRHNKSKDITGVCPTSQRADTCRPCSPTSPSLLHWQPATTENPEPFHPLPRPLGSPDGSDPVLGPENAVTLPPISSMVEWLPPPADLSFEVVKLSPAKVECAFCGRAYGGRDPKSILQKHQKNRSRNECPRCETLFCLQEDLERHRTETQCQPADTAGVRSSFTRKNRCDGGFKCVHCQGCLGSEADLRGHHEIRGKNGICPRIYSPRIPEEDWSLYEEEIRRLYQSMTRKQLVEHMKERHNFTPTYDSSYSPIVPPMPVAFTPYPLIC